MKKQQVVKTYDKQNDVQSQGGGIIIFFKNGYLCLFFLSSGLVRFSDVFKSIFCSQMVHLFV